VIAGRMQRQRLQGPNLDHASGPALGLGEGVEPLEKPEGVSGLG
jgi:hypothetical protein